ncbi:MAG: extracellular solute-binding protein, partial [Oscillospiraceae bacterium]|nr:extracellular solute-binding protein [Oscillospiraceae bacterium]
MKNFKKTLALLAALALSATALYGCGPAAGGDSKPAAGNDGNSATEESKTEESSVADGGETAANGDQLTILCWNANDSQPMVDLFCEKTGTDASLINIKNFNVQGGQASEQYTQYLANPDNDADIMFLEADWCLNFINDDAQTLPLSEIGYSDSDFSDIYDYVVETGKSTTTGALKGISWQAAAGGFCYREDLAEQYLGVKTPDEMQEKVKDWDIFLATAKALKDANGPALSATLGGVWQVY